MRNNSSKTPNTPPGYGLDDLTPAAVSADLGLATPPSSLEIEPLGTGVGLLGTLARVTLVGASGGPTSLVAKLPTTDPANQAIVDRFGYDRREAGVYRDLLPRTGVPAPRCLAQRWDEDAGRGWLLLEDLGALAVGDQVAGATDDEAVATVEALAQWHAAWWDDPALGHHAWLPDTTDPVITGYGELFDLTWPMCRDLLAGRPDSGVHDPTTIAAVAVARRVFDDAVTAFATGPRTLVHGDARLDNLRFGVEGAVLLDFQLAAHGRGAYDVAFFCAGSLTAADRRRLEPILLDHYLATLRTEGVAGYEHDRLRADYRLGLALNLPNPVTALVAVNPGDERGAELLRRNAERALASVADHFGTTGSAS